MSNSYNLMIMFEVEQKFKLSDLDIVRLTDGAEFLGEKKFTDVYYDTEKFTLTSQDIWLRSRGENFELKLPMYKVGEGELTNQYQEIESEEKIREIFAIPIIKSFIEDIEALGYFPCCTCTTTRKKYKKGKFVIDLDLVEAQDFNYAIGEIELMVEEKSQMADAIAEIVEFAKEHEIKIEYVRGKVLEYLKRKKPEHFQALVDAGVIKKENM